MAIAHSMTFAGPAKQIWGNVVKAGNTILEANAAAKQIKYKASGGGWAWAQIVTVSVAAVEERETIVTVRAEAESSGTLTEGSAQRSLIKFVFDELTKKFLVIQDQEGESMNAPGASNASTGLVVTAIIGIGLVLLVLVAAFSRP